MSHYLTTSTLVAAAVQFILVTSQKGELVFPLFLFKLPVLHKISKQYFKMDFLIVLFQFSTVIQVLECNMDCSGRKDER